MQLFTGDFNPILIAAAVIPAIILMILVYKTDKLEREPIGSLIRLVFYGMLSTLLASALETAGEFLLGLFCRSEAVYRILLYVVIVGIGEELCKFLLLKTRTWTLESFNCRYDGVVYAAFIALGFALWENIQYVLLYGFDTALIRAVTAVPGHCSFGVFMGIWYGSARQAAADGDDAKARRALFLSVLLPGLVHGAYDLIATSETDLSLLFIPCVLVIFVLAYLNIKKASKNDEYFSDAVLGAEDFEDHG